MRATIDRITAEVQQNMSKAQDRMSIQANTKRRDVTYSEGQQVLVSAVNMNLPSTLSRKFKQRYIGPFPIERVISPVSYRLTLPAAFKIYPVFHVSLLKAYTTPLSVPPPPKPLDEEDNQWEVEQLIRKRRSRTGRTEYLVRWTGFGPEDDSWVSASDIDPDLITAFESKR
jgi:hypothetical protein